jgi:hypothetical protein
MSNRSIIDHQYFFRKNRFMKNTYNKEDTTTPINNILSAPISNEHYERRK